MALPSVGGGYQLGDGNLNEQVLGDQSIPNIVVLTGTANTLTGANIGAGIVTINAGGGGASAITLPTGPQLDSAFQNAKIYSSVDLIVINLSTTTGDIANFATNTGITLVGNMYVAVGSASAPAASSAWFRFIRNAVGAWSVYRIG